MQEFDLAVVGAGVVGASIAWHAAQKGMRVASIDAVGPAAAASGASDGAVSVASKRPGLMANLANQSLAYSASLATYGGPLENVFATRPSYFFASTEAEMAALDRLTKQLAALGDKVRVVHDVSTPKRVLPEIGSSVLRLIEIEGEGHMLGYAATQAFLNAAKATCFWRSPLQSWEESDRAIDLRLPEINLRASQVVFALGVGTTQWFPKLPVIPRAGQIIITDSAQRGKTSLKGALTAGSYLLSKSDYATNQTALPLVIDPLSTGQFLIGSSREPHGDSQHTDVAVLKALLVRAVSTYPALAKQRVIRSFTGVRAAVVDGLPIVGRLPGSQRSWVATGFEGDGICLSAWAGRSVIGLLQGEHLSDCNELSPDRFY